MALRVRAPRGKCSQCGQEKDLWPRRCPGSEYHICPGCAMTNYCSNVFACPKDDCKREYSLEERANLYELCAADMNYATIVGPNIRMDPAKESWCWIHGGIIGTEAVATNACPVQACTICKRCSIAWKKCFCGHPSQYQEPPDCEIIS